MRSFNPCTEKDLAFLKKLVGEERIAIGQSYLALQSRDESYHKGYFPDVVVWPKSAEEVSLIMKMANERMIPLTP